MGGVYRGVYRGEGMGECSYYVLGPSAGFILELDEAYECVAIEIVGNGIKVQVWWNHEAL
jgi:hypothetical protein